MSLLDEAVKLQSRSGVACAVHDFEEANPKLHAELMAALAVPRRDLSAASISRALLVNHGVKMDQDILTRHRRRDCARCRS